MTNACVWQAGRCGWYDADWLVNEYSRYIIIHLHQCCANVHTRVCVYCNCQSAACQLTWRVYGVLLYHYSNSAVTTIIIRVTLLSTVREAFSRCSTITHTHTHTHSLSLCFNGHLSRCTWVSRYQYVSVLDFIGAKDDGGGGGGGGDSWSYKMCKAPVWSSPPTNQHPVLTGRMPFGSPNQQC